MAKRTASCYPTVEQHDRWRARADELGMTLSDFVASMVEAGVKAAEGFEPGVRADEAAGELREQRNELRDELDAARGRIGELEERAYGGERREAERFAAENPGCTHGELVQHLQSTVPGRVPRLAGDLVVDERPDGRDGYWPRDDQGAAAATDGEAEHLSGLGAAVRDTGGR